MKLVHLFAILMIVMIISCGSNPVATTGGGASTTVAVIPMSVSFTASREHISGEIKPPSDYTGKIKEIEVYAVDPAGSLTGYLPHLLAVDSLGKFTGPTPYSGTTNLFVRDFKTNLGITFIAVNSGNSSNVFSGILKTMANLAGQIDSTKGQYIICLEDTPFSTQSTKSGKFTISSVPAGTYTLQISKPTTGTGSSGDSVASVTMGGTDKNIGFIKLK